MTILIVEDDVHKGRQITEYVKSLYPDAAVLERASFSGGQKALMDRTVDLAIVDMSLPTFDVGDEDQGGRIRSFGGRDLLDVIEGLGRKCRVIVVTQFETFGEGRERQTLKELTEELRTEFPAIFVGTVYYHPSRSDWRNELRGCLTKASRS